MDISLLITGIVLITLVIFPFLLYRISQKKKEAKTHNELLLLAESEKSNISQKEFWRQRYGIGIDEKSKRVFYVDAKKDKEERTIINLSEVDKCRIDTISRNAKNKTGSITIIESLDLVFTMVDKTEKTIQFYNSSEFFSTDNERTIIEKWFTIINSNLKSARI